MAYPLEGLRVTDFCWMGAGSYTTKLLADMGADIVKIESNASLDGLRLAPPFKDKIAGVNRSGYFADRNTSKRSITVNMKTEKGKELVRELVKTSDLVANNFAPGKLEKLGFSYEDLKAINPSIIYLGMSFQGIDGPDRDALGFGLTMGALVGLQYLTGLPGLEPAGTGTNYPDHIPNPGHAAFAILAALRHRRRTGQGQRIEMAQIEPPLALMAPAMMNWAVNRQDTPPTGNRDGIAAPRGVYPCLGDDRWIAISVADDPGFAALTEILVDPELADPHWQSLTARHDDADRLDAIIGRATLGWVAEDLMAALQQRGIAAGVVLTAADVVANDPQLQHRQHFRRFPHPETETMLYNAPPFRFGSLPVGPRFGAPLLGEHTDEICGELGISAETIAALREEGVLS
jgi:benzylsuccinate CoA-transferase BbsF subunit